VNWHYIDTGKPQQNGFIGSLSDNLRPSRQVPSQSLAQARWTLERCESSTHAVIVQTDDEEYKIQIRKLSL
jgi:hypothetical protein